MKTILTNRLSLLINELGGLSNKAEVSRNNYFSWFNQMGFTLLATVGTGLYWGVPLVTDGIWFVPLAGAFCFGLIFSLFGVTPALAGGVAWWISLLILFFVGGVTLGSPTGVAVLTPGGLLLDLVGLPYVFLTVSLIPLVVLASLDSIRKNQVTYYFWVLFLGGVLVLCFCVEDFLVFYILFEILGFPMFLLIGQHGPRSQRVGAAYKFFVYTFGGSAFILPVLVYLQRLSRAGLVVYQQLAIPGVDVDVDVDHLKITAAPSDLP